MSELFCSVMKAIYKLVSPSRSNSMYSPLLPTRIVYLITKQWPFSHLSLCSSPWNVLLFPFYFPFQPTEIRTLDGQVFFPSAPPLGRHSWLIQSFWLPMSYLQAQPHWGLHGSQSYISSEPVPSSWQDPCLFLLGISRVPSTLPFCVVLLL